MAFSTLEVRWFFDGPLEETGPGIEEWFRTRPRLGGSGTPRPLAWTPAPPAWRQDRYLPVPDCDDMGIKWREGRLEIKGRASALGERTFAPGIEGVCERWIKWSYGGDRVAQRCSRLFQDGVVAVEKRRLQRLFRFDDAGAATEAAPDQSRERGLNVELTRIRLPGRGEAHWSLAFEAFPANAHMAEPFTTAVARFLEGCPALPLSAARSMSYPRWLLDFDRPAAPGDGAPLG
ncbi:MAG TPA: hypothetical protein VE597_01910 [Geminicoccaceae bacterium]|nr:hypothetical protein [Geminicoccaceae bacterium]